LRCPSLKEFDRVDLKDNGKLFEYVDGCGVFTALQHSHVVSIDVSTGGQFLLRNAFGMAQSS
jgi:hypothetical protein